MKIVYETLRESSYLTEVKEEGEEPLVEIIDDDFGSEVFVDQFTTKDIDE